MEGVTCFSEAMERLWEANARLCDQLKLSEPLHRMLFEMAREWESRGGKCEVKGYRSSDFTFKANKALKAADFKIMMDDYFGDTDYIVSSDDNGAFLKYSLRYHKDAYHIEVYALKESFKGCVIVEEEEYLPPTRGVSYKLKKVICGS